jgi:long-chain acyl-CoA synthetase
MTTEFPAPVLTLAEANALLTAPGGRFETVEVEIRGQRYRTFKDTPATLRTVFERSAMFADREFLIHDDERITYDAFRRATLALCRRLIDDGLRPGDRAGIIMRNMPEWIVAYYAILLAGGIVTPLNSWWTGRELEFGLTESGCRMAIADPERLAVIRPHLDACPELARVYVARAGAGQAEGDPRVVRLETVIGAPADWAGLPMDEIPDIPMNPDDDAAILFTSGTTGRPKGAVATHRNILGNIPAIAFGVIRSAIRWGAPVPPAVDPVTAPQRVNLATVPLFHATGMVTQVVIAPWSGFKVVMMRKWDAAQAVEIIARERVTVVGGVPTIAWQLVEQAEQSDVDLSSLMSITYGGAPAAAELTRRIRARFPQVGMSTGWGMTETTATATSVSGLEYETHAGTAGCAVPVNELQIRDPEDGVTVLPTRTTGELWMRGPQVVRGYWNRPDATAETFVDGWLRTGDLAWMDEEGYVTIADRAKDMIIRGGENIYCLEVENAIYEHPDVLDAAVVGIPHPRLGEVPGAVIRLCRGSQATAADLSAFVAERIARFKVPERILFLEENLPRNANGKPLKNELRDMFAPA